MRGRTDSDTMGWQQVSGLLWLVLGILIFLSLVSYDPADVSLLQDPPQSPPVNFIGPAGAWAGFALLMGFGVAAFLVPLALIVQAGLMLFMRHARVGLKICWLWLMVLALLCIVELQSDLWDPISQRLNAPGAGGVLGGLLAQQVLARLMGEVGAAVLAGAVLLTGLFLMFEIHPKDAWRTMVQGALAGVATGRRLIEQWRARTASGAPGDEEERALERRRRELEQQIKSARPAAPRISRTVRPESAAGAKPEEVKPAAKPPPPEKPAARRSAPPPPSPAGRPGGFQLPPLSLLQDPPNPGRRATVQDNPRAPEILKETMAEFGIPVEVTNVTRGPAVTRYELLPAPGVRVERIAGLSNNIALAMKAESVRVQAPIPGKGVVGIEVPNAKSTTVYLREMLESDSWQQGKAQLPLALGKDVAGHEIVGDLARMPHLLIAGATGSGKTVCMNSMLAGLLMSRTPDELKLILIDPKIVEFSAFNGLPHLAAPVITNPKKVNLGLRWVIQEMERRYKLFAKVGVRNIEAFNERPIIRQPELFGDSEAPPPEPAIPERLPFIVVVVDELADLMMVAQADIENSIARLAQLSRAVGIHMILATQRPSVNVITGTIKANFPARIAFQVAQKVDSRTILDANGADTLLGRGDMLFLPPGTGKLVRAQGSMTSDSEIHAIVDFLREQGEPQFMVTIKDSADRGGGTEEEEVEGRDDEDETLLESAVEVIRQTRRASTSSLQRRLRIGYTRAARVMDILEERGIVGPPRGSDPREILVDMDGDLPTQESDGSNGT